MNKLKLNLKTRLLLPIIVSIVLLVSLTQYVIYNISSNIVLQEAKNEMALKVENIVDLINLQLTSNENYTQLLSNNPDVINVLSNNTAENRNKAKRFFMEIKKNRPEIDTIIVVTPQGLTIASENENYLGIDLSKREYLKIALSGTTNISKVIKSKGNGKAIFTISSPVKKQNKIIGAILTSENIDSIEEKYIKPVKMGESGYALMENSIGLLISHPNKKLVLNEEFSNSNSETKKALKLYPDAQRYWWEKSHEYKLMTTKATKNGWLIALVVPENELFKVLEPVKIISITGGIILILIISIVVIIIISPIAKTMTAVNAAILKLSEGDVTEKTEQSKILNKSAKRNDEIGHIALAVHNIQQYLCSMSETAYKISEKNLTVTPEIKGENDILGNALAKILQEFGRTFSHVNNTVNMVNKGSTHLSSASQSLSSAATEQAASIEEITSSVTELGSQTKDNAENAAEANKLSGEANITAITGKEQMDKLSQAMNDISLQAQETQKVIKSIDDIAFQTNLLALNAAVEAARAGVHGKGFAVVAEEVRNLAARSAKAAGETTDLIQNMVKKIEDGNTMTDITAKSLNEIASAIKKATLLVAEISQASNNQAEGVSQIDIALKQIADITQSNTANAEETASSSSQMLSISTNLKNIIDEFKINDNYQQNQPVKNTHRKKQDDIATSLFCRSQCCRSTPSRQHKTQ